MQTPLPAHSRWQEELPWSRQTSTLSLLLTPLKSSSCRQTKSRLRLPELTRELNQTSHGDSRWTFCDPGFRVFHPGGAGDVEMDPGRVLGEFLQKLGGSDRATPASAGVHKVGDVRFDLLFIFVVEGQPPHLFSGFVERCLEAVVDVVVVGEDSGIR